MHPIPPALLHLLLLPITALFLSVTGTTSFSTNETFPNCNQTFSCGPLRDITYPFIGGPRPAHCGLPGFNLSCNDGSFPELTFDSLSYRFIQLDQTHRNMTLSRSDLYNNTCPHEFTNTTLDFTIFNLSSVQDNKDLTLFYGCSSAMSYKPGNLFSCDIGAKFSDAYYIIGPVPIDPRLNIINCTVSVTVPILKKAADMLVGDPTMLREVLMQGFNLSYSVPYGDECAMCLDSGWECGFDSGSGRPIRIRGDRICLPAGVHKKKNKAVVRGLSIAAGAIVGIFLASGFLLVRQRRKKIAAQSKSKDLPTPPSSKGRITTSTSLSESIPSYPLSKSDLEKGSTCFGVQVFSYTELEEATDNFDPSKELGDGGFGIVYYGVLNDGRVVAVKRLYEKNLKRVGQFMNEVDILTRLRHPNLVTLYGCTSRRSRELLLVYEYIPNGTVADHIHGNRANSGLLTWPVRLKIAIETASALRYLHISDVIHRDVKTNNILLDNNFCVKVADFGLSRLFPNDVTHVSTAPQGTPGYVDPEYYQCYQLTDKSDVYSFGVVLIELISAKEAVDTNRHRHDINLANMAISRIQNHALHELVDPTLGFENDSVARRMITLVAELAFRCLQQERDMRPSMDEVLEILQGIQDEEFGAQKAEVVDIGADDVGLLKNIRPPLSPDSVVTDKWVSSSTTPSSSCV